MRDYFKKSEPLRFCFPIDGDCLDLRDGAPDGDSLLLPVTVEAPTGHTVSVSGVPAGETENGVYTATVRVTGYRSTLTAKDATDGTETHVTVLRLPVRDRSFRISSDDNIRFLAELTAGDYASIFDHPYLAVYKKAHDLYGAKVHLNLFYAFDDEARACFSDEHAYFDLSMMTDRYKEEFTKNSDWLKLSFHAESEFPPSPYQNATAEQITADCVKVCREIIRFAGRDSLSDATTVHFGAANEEGVRALRALGIRALAGYFELHHGKPLVSYYAPEELVLHVGARDFWFDRETDMLFLRIDRVVNIGSLDAIMQDVPEIVADPHRGGFFSLMIHEQYFYSDYKRYLPDFEERVLAPCRYLWEHGYVGVHASECLPEQPLREHPLLRG